MLVVIGPDGPEMVNYRVKGDMYIVDRLFERGALILGVGKKARRVEVIHGTYRGKGPKGDPYARIMNSPEIESPTGIDLEPEPPRAVRVSKRAGLVVLLVAIVIALIGFGVLTRNQRSLRIGFQFDETKGITAATDAGKVVSAQVPARPMLGPSAASLELLPPPGSSDAFGADASGPLLTHPCANVVLASSAAITATAVP